MSELSYKEALRDLLIEAIDGNTVHNGNLTMGDGTVITFDLTVTLKEIRFKDESKNHD